MSKICHILCCGHKFIPCVIRMYETVNPGNNIYIEYSTATELTEGFKRENNISFHPYGDISFAAEKIIRENDITHVFFHFFFPACGPLLKAVKPYCKTVICCGGADIDFFSGDYIDPETLATLRNLYSTSMMSRARKFVSNCKNKLLLNVGLDPQLRYLRYFDYCASALWEDYDKIKTRYPRIIRAEYVDYCWGGISDCIPNGLLEESIDGDDILIGNSAWPNLNHIDALRHLAHCDIGSRTVYIPLSYGDKVYRDAVQAEAKRLFGAQACCITDFLPRDEYIHLLKQCRHVYMRIHKQCALGNIYIALWLGARVYIPEDCVVSKAFRRLGLTVYSPNTLADTFMNNLDQPEKMAQNRIVISDFLGEEALAGYLKKMFQHIGYKS